MLRCYVMLHVIQELEDVKGCVTYFKVTCSQCDGMLTNVNSFIGMCPSSFKEIFLLVHHHMN